MTRAREEGLDALRGLSVVAMFAVHAARLGGGPNAEAASAPWGAVEHVCARALGVLTDGEPLITAAFVAIAGRAAALQAAPRWTPSEQLASPADVAARRGSGPRLALRALGLHAVAVALCLAQYGPAWPDVLLSPGVLTPIALGSLGVTLAHRGAWPRTVLGVGAGVVLLVAVWLERRGSPVVGLDGGPGGSVPLVAFALVFGAVVDAARGVERRLLTAVAVVGVPFLVAVMAGWADLTTTHQRWFPAGGGEVGLQLMLSGSWTTAPMAFWNHSVVGSLALLTPVAAALGLAANLGDTLRRAWTRALAGLGRHALLAYVGHLGALGAITLLGWAPQTAVATWGLVATLCVGATLGGALVERFHRAER